MSLTGERDGPLLALRPLTLPCMPPSPPPLREVASPVEHLSNLIQRGSLAQILYELRTNVVWATPAPPPPPAASPAPAAHLLPSPIDQLTTLGQPLLSLALESSAWRSDALECFVLLLQAGANPERRDSVGRRVEWELEGRDEAFRREWVRAREARRARRAYELRECRCFCELSEG